MPYFKLTVNDERGIITSMMTLNGDSPPLGNDQKENSMKSTLLFYLSFIMVFVQACSSSTSIATTALASPTLAIATATMETTVPTTEPSPTVDPNMPPDATGKDTQGNFIKTFATEKGNTLTSIWDKERKVWVSQIFYGAVWDQPGQGKDQLYMTVTIDNTIEGWQSLPTLKHHNNVDPINAQNWTKLFQNQLIPALINKGFGDKNNFDFTPWFDGSHKWYVDYTNADGPQRMGLWDGTNISVRVRGDYGALKANTSTNGFSEVASVSSYGPANDYMAKVWSDKDGNTYFDIAPSLRPATSWSHRQIYEMFLMWLEILEKGPDMSHVTQGQLLDILVVSGNKLPNSQLIDFGPSQ